MDDMSSDTVWVISTVITAAVALAGFMYALVNGVHKRIDDVRADLSRLHDDHKQLVFLALNRVCEGGIVAQCDA